MNRPRVLVIGRSRAIERALGASAVAGLFVVSSRTTPNELTEADRKRPPQIILIDRPSLDPAAIMLIDRLARDFSEVPLLVVAESATDREVLEALRAGASGCLFREDLEKRLVPAIHDSLDGGAPMSRAVANMVLSRARRSSAQMRAVRVEAAPVVGPRKREILEMLAKGLSYDQIGMSLDISVNTVRSHVRDIYSLLEASTKVEAVMSAVEWGILKRRA